MDDTEESSGIETGEALLDGESGRRKLAASKFDIPRPVQDIGFAVLFLGNVLVLLSLAFTHGASAVDHRGPSTTTIAEDNTKVIDASGNKTGKFVGGVFLSLLIGGFLSIGWVRLMTFLSNEIITYTFGIIVVICIVGGVAFFTSGVLAAGVGMMILALVVFVLFVYLRPRMNFAATTLKIACEAVRTLPLTFLLSIGLLVVQIVYCLIWTIAAIGVATNESKSTISANGKTYNFDQCSTFYYSTYVDIGGTSLQCTSGSTCVACICGGSTIMSSRPCFVPKLYGGVYFLLLLSLFWGCTVITNVVVCMTSGAVSSWWVKPAAQVANGSEIVKNSFQHAVTTSFGSICLGSLLVAIVKTVRTLVKFSLDHIRPTNQSQVSGGLYAIPGCSTIQLMAIRCLDLSLRLLDSIMDYFNRYAFCYVSIYGYSFFESSRAVISMLRQRGLTAVINDDIIEIVLSLGHLVVALCACIFAYLFGRVMQLDVVNLTLLSLSGFFGGYLMCAVMLKVISAAVATIYVCFAEDPEEFEFAHPDLYHDLALKWSALYPEAMPPGVRAQSIPSKDAEPSSGGNYVPPTVFGTGASIWGRGGGNGGGDGGGGQSVRTSIGRQANVGSSSGGVYAAVANEEVDDIEAVEFSSAGRQTTTRPQSLESSQQQRSTSSSSGVMSSVGAGATVVYEEFSKMFRPGEGSAPYYPPPKVRHQPPPSEQHSPSTGYVPRTTLYPSDAEELRIDDVHDGGGSAII